MIKAINRSIAARHEEDEKGFTLIELLVVILIIGVLAAIAIPAFLNQRQGAWESQVKSDIANAAIAAESFAVANNGKYQVDATTTIVGDGSQLKEYGFNPTADVDLVIALDGDGYTIAADHDSITDKTWLYTSSDGTTEEVAVP